jgi:hypothetical protein
MKIRDFSDPDSIEWEEFDPLRFTAWLATDKMERISSPRIRHSVAALFHEAGIRPRFRGGLLVSGKDCPRVAGILADYAFDLMEDVRIVCQNESLYLLACHEGDIHLGSCDTELLKTASNKMQRCGLSVAPNNILRVFPKPELSPEEAAFFYGE